MDTVDILSSFIKAQRTGNWSLHMSAIRSMLPYLASSGHHLYTKADYLYLQMMSKLPETNASVYNNYFMDGYHVARRSNRYWGGLSTDLKSEQVFLHYLLKTDLLS